MNLRNTLGILAFAILFAAGVILCIASRFDDNSPVSWAGISSMAVSVLFLVSNISPVMAYIRNLL